MCEGTVEKYADMLKMPFISIEPFLIEGRVFFLRLLAKKNLHISVKGSLYTNPPGVSKTAVLPMKHEVHAKNLPHYHLLSLPHWMTRTQLSKPCSNRQNKWQKGPLELVQVILALKIKIQR